MIAFKPDFGRLRKVLLRDGEPDLVPFYELFADNEIMREVTGRKVDAESLLCFIINVGYDYVTAWINYEYPKRVLSIDNTAELSKGKRHFVDANIGTIETRNDFDSYEWPETERSAAGQINDINRNLPDNMKVILLTPGGILQNVMWLMGYTPFSYALYEDEQLIWDMFERVGTNHIELLKACFENSDVQKIGAVAMGDDMGTSGSTIISPDMLRKYVFPWQKRVVELVHSYQMPMILHSCGKVDDIMDD